MAIWPMAKPPAVNWPRQNMGRGRKGIQWIVKKIGLAPGEQADGTFAVEAATATALERQLRESIAAAQNGKPSASAVTPAPGRTAACRGGWLRQHASRHDRKARGREDAAHHRLHQPDQAGRQPCCLASQFNRSRG